MTLWLVILFAFLAILSPAVWLKPSRRDRRLGRLRQHARDAGVRVKFTKPPLHEPPGGVVSYRWLYPQEAPGPYFLVVRESHASDALKPFMEGWRWRIEPLRPLTPEARRCLMAALAQLPEDALVVASERGSLTLWWGESLEVGAFSVCQSALVSARDALAGAQQASGAPSAPP